MRDRLVRLQENRCCT